MATPAPFGMLCSARVCAVLRSKYLRDARHAEMRRLFEWKGDRWERKGGATRAEGRQSPAKTPADQGQSQ